MLLLVTWSESLFVRGINRWRSLHGWPSGKMKFTWKNHKKYLFISRKIGTATCFFVARVCGWAQKRNPGSNSKANANICHFFSLLTITYKAHTTLTYFKLQKCVSTYADWNSNASHLNFIANTTNELILKLLW